MTTRDLSQKELSELVKLVAAPAFKYILKRINNYILIDNNKTDMSFNSFISVVVIALASIDANMLKWVEEFYKAKVGQSLDVDKLRFSLMKNLNEQLGIKTH